MSERRRFLFAGGGTGGHVFPALAIAEAIRVMDEEAAMHFAGSRNKIEARVVPQNGHTFHPIWISGIQRSFSFSTLLVPLKLAVSLVQSWILLRRVRPSAVVGTGGYVSGPVLYVASLCGYPTLIQEQNEYPGITTRLLARRVDEVHIAFERTKELLPRTSHIEMSGNPVRLQSNAITREEARSKFGLPDGGPVVFVFGGSQGSRAINTEIRNMLPKLRDAGVRLLWQTGRPDYAEIKKAAAGSGASVSVYEFIDDMCSAYAASDLVICRAGAASIAELTALGLPSILVPYPYAAANHQFHNAQALVQLGASRMIEDKNIAGLGDMLFPLIDDREMLKRMSLAAREAGRPDAARRIAQAVLRLAERHKQGGSDEHI
jgi:UDP-N-acetylglucosamine--N-acetylmuramyl-(pentapeptide) pyrophosphoryl-undecaprenol N-acetylglucosamine transferase